MHLRSFCAAGFLSFSVAVSLNAQQSSWDTYRGITFSVSYPTNWKLAPLSAQGFTGAQITSNSSMWGGVFIVVADQPDSAVLDDLLASQTGMWADFFAKRGGTVNYGSPEPTVYGSLEGKSVTGNVSLPGAPPVVSIVSVFRPNGRSVAIESDMLAKDQWTMAGYRHQILSSLDVVAPAADGAPVVSSENVVSPIQGDALAGDWYKKVSDGYNTTTTWLTLRADGTYKKLRQARFFPQGVVAFSQEGTWTRLGNLVTLSGDGKSPGAVEDISTYSPTR